MTGLPTCGNDPRTQLTDAARATINQFKDYLRVRAELASGRVTPHHVLYVVPDARTIRRRRVELPSINTRVIFATPLALRDGHLIRGLTLCHVIGEDLLGLQTTAYVRTRLRDTEHECPGRHPDFTEYLRASTGTDEWR
jgi:hypothetical protein